MGSNRSAGVTVLRIETSSVISAGAATPSAWTALTSKLMSTSGRLEAQTCLIDWPNDRTNVSRFLAKQQKTCKLLPGRGGQALSVLKASMDPRVVRVGALNKALVRRASRINCCFPEFLQATKKNPKQTQGASVKRMGSARTNLQTKQA